jgi:Leucine-rich repeat (LRR) protein
MPSRLTVVSLSLLLAIPAVIFWLWLLTQPIREAKLCPEECRCEEGGGEVNCSDSGLNRIPSTIPTHVRRLVLDGNNITFFENDTFVSKGLVDLEVLQAYYCKIRKIQLGAFNGLTFLIYLLLENNDISEIIPGTFETISRLQYLNLKYNKIEHLESEVFRGLVKLQYINLEGNKLQYLHPDMIFGLRNLQSLLLSNNSNLQLPIDRHFINSHSLKFLAISECDVRSVSVETFANVSALEILDLSYNFLTNLDINIFTILPELSLLGLKTNRISEIIPGTLENFSRLESLALDFNDIEVLGSGTFFGFVNLRNIYLKGNALQYLHPDTFVGLPNLQHLDLEFNFLLEIPTDRHFINSYSLKRLDISLCNIHSVSVETFAHVSALEKLNLNYNYLRSVDINILKVLPNLSTLYLYHNPLQCDCQLQEVWRWCLDHNIQTSYEELTPICDTPSEVKGIWWGVLENGQCLQDNIHYYGNYKNISYSYTPIADIEMDTKTDTDRENEQWINVYSVVEQYGLPVSAVMFVFGTIGNVALIIIITCNKDMRTVPNMYILNLTISDMIYLTALFLDALTKRISMTWLHGEIGCACFAFCYRMSVSLSAYSVAVLSIQRYKVTVNPLHFRVSSQPTWRGTGAIICGVWIVAVLFAIPAACSQCLTHTSFLIWVTYYYQQSSLFNLLVSCVIPLCVIAFCYIMTARHLVKSSCPVSEQTQNPRLNKRKNSAKVVMGLTLVFIISYLPYHTIMTYSIYSIDFHKPLAELTDQIIFVVNLRDITLIMKYFLSINSCLNPVALFCTSLAFRRHFKRYLTCCCKTKSPSAIFELTRRN